MIGSTSREASLFYFAFAKEAMAIADDVLDPLDPLLEDPQLVQVAAQILTKRRARSADFGRPSIAPDRLLRCLVLKHCKTPNLQTVHKSCMGLQRGLLASRPVLERNAKFSLGELECSRA